MVVFNRGFRWDSLVPQGVGMNPMVLRHTAEHSRPDRMVFSRYGVDEHKGTDIRFVQRMTLWSDRAGIVAE